MSFSVFASAVIYAPTKETTQAVETPKVVEEKKEEASPTPVTTETTDTSVKTENE